MSSSAETQQSPIIFNEREYSAEEYTLVNCKTCGTPWLYSNNDAIAIASGLCGKCYREEKRKTTRKACAICGDHVLPLDGKETQCADCKATLKGKNTDMLPMPEPVGDPAGVLRYTNLAKMLDERGTEHMLVGYRASNIPPENPEWLVPQRIPLRKHTIFAGRPGGGKSSAALDIAARTSSGADWMDGSKNIYGPMKVLYFATEDGLADTLVPRLMAAGANLENVIFPQWVLKTTGQGKKTNGIISIKNHLALLARSLEETKGVGLVVLDPLTSFLGVNINKDEELRPVMDRLSAMLETTHTTFISIVHHNKKSDVSALEKILGSSSLVGSARAIWDFSRDPDDRNTRYMSLVKLNIDEEPDGLKFSIGSREIKGIKCSQVDWDGTTTESADDLLQRSREKRKESPIMVAARQFLKSHLERGERKSSGDDGLIEIAKREGISKATLWRAKEELGLVWVKRGIDYFWSLPRPEQFIPAETGQVM